MILQTIEGIGIALGYLSEIKGQIIPEATIHLRKSTWRDQTWTGLEASCLRIISTVLEEAMQPAKGER